MNRFLFALVLVASQASAQLGPVDIEALVRQLRPINTDIILIERKSSAASPQEKANLEQLRKQREEILQRINEAKKGLAP